MDRGKLVNELKGIADVLYKGETNKGFSMIGGVLPDMQAVSLEMDEESRSDFLNNALSPALEAMQTKDSTLLADIITYEILERVNA